MYHPRREQGDQPMGEKMGHIISPGPTGGLAPHFAQGSPTLSNSWVIWGLLCLYKQNSPICTEEHHFLLVLSN